ncbi:putative dihydrodipicolinate synthase [Aureobasidium pullulans]|nr:putative dihydrodipicolinate synthase [Aureobasidium pullulans]
MLFRERHSSVCCLKSGVYTPLPTFSNEDEELNLEEYEEHLIRECSCYWTPSTYELTNPPLDKQGFESVPIVAGVGGLSTRETVHLAQDAASAGAAVGMVIPPAYYAATLQQDSSQIEQYYIDICRLSPIPLLLYNFPANSAGQDLSAKSIIRIIENLPNLCGLKLTCPGRVHKLAQVTALVKTNPELLVLDGVMHDLPAWKEFGGHGTVSGISNIAPSSTVTLWNLCCLENPSLEQQKELREVLNVLSKIEARCHRHSVQNVWESLATLWGRYGSQILRHFHILRCPDPLPLLEEQCSMKVLLFAWSKSRDGRTTETCPW